MQLEQRLLQRFPETDVTYDQLSERLEVLAEMKRARRTVASMTPVRHKV